MEKFCEDCNEAVAPCGYGEELCNSPQRLEGILHALSVRTWYELANTDTSDIDEPWPEDDGIE